MASAKDLVRFLRGLRSVRRFAPRPVPPEVVDDLLEVARWSGSSSNAQPCELIIVRDRETLRALAGEDGPPGAMHLADAALAVVLVMSTSGSSGNHADFDAGRCCERIMLTLAAHGIGSSIAGLAGRGERAAAVLGVPADRVARVAISVGYPAADGAHLVSVEREVDQRLPLSRMRLGRRPLTEIAHYERYGER